MALNTDEFTKFFETVKKGTYVCPFCGSVKFSFGMTYEGVPAVVTAPMDVQPGIRPGYHAYQTLVCDNCGRTDFFHLHKIEAWKIKNAGEKK